MRLSPQAGRCRVMKFSRTEFVVYLWPRAGGTTFSFSLKARFAMRAQSAESVLYDYYNPKARASVPPTRFVVK
jgi:hypothetical protein